MAQGAVQNRSAWDVTMEPRLRELFTYGLKNNDDWKKFWTVTKSDKMREEVAEYATPDVTEETPEGNPYVTLNMSIVRTSSAVAIDYTGQIVITHQMKRDKKYNEMEERSWGLGEAVARKPQEIAVALMFNGFGSVQSSDKRPWFDTQHPLKNDPTKLDSNLIVDPLSPNGLNNAIIALQKTLNENGKPIPMGNGEVNLYVTPTNRILAQQLEDSGDYLPNSPNFNKNKFKVKATVLPFLYMCEDAHKESQWYLQDDMYSKNTMFEREGPDFETITDPHTDNTIVKVRHAFSFLVNNHRGTVGSKGLG